MIVAPIRCLFKRFTILVSLLSLAAYAASCGTAHSPVASTDDRSAYFTHFEIPVSGFSSYGLRGK